MAVLELIFFGGFEARLDGQPVVGLESDKVRLLLAYLVVESGHAHRRETLSGLFWPESSERRARQSLNQSLYNLRQVIGQEKFGHWFELSPQDVRFHQNLYAWVDVLHFSLLMDEVHAHPHAAAPSCRQCVQRLTLAAELFAGEFLAGFSLADSEVFEDWLRTKRERLNELVLSGLRYLIQSSLKRGDLDQALRVTDHLARLDRFDEQNLRQRLILLARKGRRLDALQAYQEYARLLANELAVEPEAATLEIHDQINHQFETFADPQKPPHNLPAAATRLVGRQDELEELYWKLIDPDCRLVTILGMGGSGKTRLAMEAGKVLLPAFPNGVFWLDLGVLSSGHDLLANLAHTLGVQRGSFLDQPDTPGQERQMLSELQDKELLLILDGAEMVLERVVALNDLLRQASKVKVLVTSRARLNLQGENLLVLEGLPYPEQLAPGWEEYPAVQFFTNIVRQTRPGFQVQDTQARAVFEICRTLKGMPLALLFAAAWTPALSPDQVLTEIHKSLDFLHSNWQDLPSRQQSLRAVFEYSWNLLCADDQAVLRKLTVFQQPFTAQQASVVTQATANNLKGLLDFSLIQRAGDERFRLHDLVRQYALEKLEATTQETLEVHTSFSNYFGDKLAAWGQDLKRSQQAVALVGMEHEIENARLAWDWMARKADWAGLERALDGLCIYYEKRGQAQNAESACAVVLNQIEFRGIDRSSLRLWARLAAWQASFWVRQGRNPQGLDRLEAVLQELQNQTWSGLDVQYEQALAWLFKALTLVRHDNPATYVCALRSAEIFERSGEAWFAARGFTLAAQALESMSRYSEQMQLCEKALGLQAEDGDPELIHSLRYILGCAYLFLGRVDVGSQMILESLDASPRSAARPDLLHKISDRMVALLWSGKFQEATEQINVIQSIHQELGYPLNSFVGGNVAIVFWGLGKYAEFITYNRNAGLEDDLWAMVATGSIYLLQGKNELACSKFQKAIIEAQNFTENRLDAMANSFCSLAYYRLGDWQRSRECLSQALQGCQDDATLGSCVSLLAITFFLLERGEVAKAVETYAAAMKLPFFEKSAWTHDFLGARLEQLAQSLPADVVEAARARGARQDMQAAALAWLDQIDSLIRF